MPWFRDNQPRAPPTDMDVDPNNDPGPVTLILPFQTRLHPQDIEEAWRRHLEWITKSSLWPGPTVRAKYEADAPAKFAAYCYPFASDSEFDLLFNFFGLAWLIGEAFQRSMSTPKRVQRTIHNLRLIIHGRPNMFRGVPLAVALEDVMKRMRSVATTELWEKHKWHWDRVYVRMSRGDPRDLDTLEKYLDYRSQNSGIPLLFSWIEILYQLEIPAYVHEDSTFRHAVEAAERTAIMIHDLFYGIDEWKNGNGGGSVLKFVMQRERCDMRGAKDWFQKSIASKANKFQQLEKEFYGTDCFRKLMKREQKDVNTFFVHLEDWLAGYLYWHYNHTRDLAREMGGWVAGMFGCWS